ncbi:MAG TPA: NHL repeat-containing protein, partial [Pyrinomonadaceae bacterium]
STLTSTPTGTTTLTISATATGITINPITVTLTVLPYGTATEIFVGNHAPGPSTFITVSRFLGDADGDVSPASEFYGDNANAVARDASGNIYVASDTGNRIRVYAPGSVGFAPPIREIIGRATKVHRPTGLALDGQGNLYVAERGGPTNQSAVLKFAPGADGDVAPIAIIPSRIPVTGEVAGVNTRMDIASGVAVDAAGSIYVVTCQEPQRPGDSKLLIFAPGANGDVAPVVEITNDLNEPQQVTLDEDENIYITNRGGVSAITVYAAAPTANVTPVRTITSADLSDPFGVAVDGAGRIFVAETALHSILVFDTGASGSVVPFRKIQGSSTGLNRPLGIAVRF